jgi:hypothetical protein
MIYRNRHNGIFVKLAAESDGYFGNFGMEYWQIESAERSCNYIGASPFTTNRSSVENSMDWERIL